MSLRRRSSRNSDGKMAVLVRDNLYRAGEIFGNLFQLRSRPMVAIDFRLKNPIPELPRGHVTLVRSKFDLTLIDVSGTDG
jgi:hypothetical protein